MISRDGASVCAKATFAEPTSACGYGYAYENGKCRKEHSVPAELRCAAGFQPHSYLPRCIKMESRDPEPHCGDHGYALEGEGLAAGCYKEHRHDPSVECATGYRLRDDGRCYSRRTSEARYECRAGFRPDEADGKCHGPCDSGATYTSGTSSSSSSRRPIRMQGAASDNAPGGAAQEPPHGQIDFAPLI